VDIAMKKKLPALSRRPSALPKSAIAGIRKKGAGVSGEAVRRVIEGEEGDGDGDADDDPDIAAARDLIASLQSFDPTHVWWVLAGREQELAQAEELDFGDAGEEVDDITAAMKMLRKRYVYAARRDEVWDRHARDWISTRALSNAQAHAMPLDDNGNAMDAMKVLARDRYADRVHNERYMPGVDQEIAHDEGVDWLNVWKPSELQPAKGDPSPMLRHLNYLFEGRAALIKHQLDWMAYVIQNPGGKINHAPLIISDHHGVGKNMLADAMFRILGKHNTAEITEEMIAEGRYDFMKRAQLLVVGETMSGDRKDLAHKLKPLLTQTVVRVNEKNVKGYDIPNIANFMMFSNNENAAHIEDNDRRYFVVISRAEPRDPQYYVDMYDYIEGEDIAGFAQFLLDRDLSHFNPKAPAPATADKSIVQKATRGGWEAWLDDAWQSDAAPFDRRVINLRDALTTVSEAKGAYSTGMWPSNP
jgi:hypothetical protein